jgi:hypothetical protein
MHSFSDTGEQASYQVPVMSRDPEPSHRCPDRSQPVAAIWALVAAFCLGTITLSVQAQTNAPGVANKFAAVSHVSWNGLELDLWRVPGYGLYAYKIAAPAYLASGWRFCKPTDGDTKTVEQCIGVWRPPIQ